MTDSSSFQDVEIVMELASSHANTNQFAGSLLTQIIHRLDFILRSKKRGIIYRVGTSKVLNEKQGCLLGLTWPISGVHFFKGANL